MERLLCSESSYNESAFYGDLVHSKASVALPKNWEEGGGRDRDETETERGAKDKAVPLMAASGVLSGGVAVPSIGCLAS